METDIDNSSKTSNKIVDKNCKPILFYTRISTSPSDEELTLDFQLSKVKDYIVGKNMYIKKVYHDIGLTRKERDNQPEFLNMMKDVEKEETIIIYSISRIYNNINKVSNIIQQIKDKESFLMFYDQNLEINKYTVDAFIYRFMCQEQLEEEAKIANNLRKEKLMSHIYILKSASDERDLYKVGITNSTIQQLENEYTLYIPDFSIYLFYKTDNAEEIQKSVKKKFGTYFTNNESYWINFPEDKLIQYIITSDINLKIA
jgi:hypothetical protein